MKGFDKNYTRRPKLTFPGFRATPERQHPKKDPRLDVPVFTRTTPLERHPSVAGQELSILLSSGRHWSRTTPVCSLKMVISPQLRLTPDFNLRSTLSTQRCRKNNDPKTQNIRVQPSQCESIRKFRTANSDTVHFLFDAATSFMLYFAAAATARGRRHLSASTVVEPDHPRR